MRPVFDLAIGNPPFSDRTVRSDRAYRSLGLRLHDYFIARSIDLLKPGALAALPRLTKSAELFARHETLLALLMTFLSEHGRLPHDDELGAGIR